MIFSVSCPRRHSRSGFILYLVFTFLLAWFIIALALFKYRSGSTNLLSKSSHKARLSAIAQSAANEIWAMVRSEMNDHGKKSSPDSFYSMFGDVLQQNAGILPPHKIFSREKAMLTADLSFSNRLASEITARQASVRGHVKVFFTRLTRPSPPSYVGHIEVITQACLISDPQEMVEQKERRDFKIIDTRDILDRYALFVKDYCYDYNCTDRQLIIEGLNSAGVCSSIFLGSRFAPDYPAFSWYDGPAPLYLDVNFNDDSNLIPLLINNKRIQIPPGITEVPSINTAASDMSRGNIFWAVTAPIPFKPIYDLGGFSDRDFYSVKVLQDGYYKIFVEPSQNTQAGQHSLPGLILEDWRRCGGDYGSSSVFKQVVKTSVESWQYLYAYTDASHVWNGSEWKDFARMLQFSGLAEYPGLMSSYHPDKSVAGKMAQFFGTGRNIPVIIEGNVFFRFFKLAFFDEFSANISLGGETKSFSMPAIPLQYQLPATAGENFLNTAVGVHGIEESLMSREVEDIPANALYFNDFNIQPAEIDDPDNYYPYVSIESVSYRYSTPQEFLEDRTVTLPDGKKCLDIDGLMFIERGNLDLSSYSSFSGQGMIWLGFRGDVMLGDLFRARPSDILKIWAQDGNFIITGNKPDVKIEASLIALSYFSDQMRDKKSLASRGKLIPNRHGVEIYGNLAVDYLFLADPNYGIPTGKQLKITHNPYLYSPVYPNWVTLGKIRTVVSHNTDYTDRALR